MSDLSGISDGALRLRQMLGREICRMLRRDWAAEEGAGEALTHYSGRVKAYTKELQRRRKAAREARGEPIPEPLTVMVKSAKLGARRGNGRG